jgi:poly-gamma-glutamate synthesis protein (capsule biosynthesis protein)
MIRLCLAGDIMLGRGIDQILGRPCHPQLHEAYIQSALDYVDLAERESRVIPRGVSCRYVWGDAGAVLANMQPTATVANLETAITDDGEPQPKGINYRMSCSNAAGLRDLGAACFALANNHVLDWGAQGLNDTLRTLSGLSVPFAGAGPNLRAAAAPAVLPLPTGRRLLVFAMACRDSGVPAAWAAKAKKAGVHVLESLDASSIERVARLIAAEKRPGDLAVVSIHWGDNWGYEAPPSHRGFARVLVSTAGADIVHGHSSHHPKAWEINNGKLILYGCGDLINDYEGISGYEAYRGTLSALYFADVDEVDGRLAVLTVVPFRIERFRLHRADESDARWLSDTLNRVCLSGHRLGVGRDLTLKLECEPREPQR